MLVYAFVPSGMERKYLDDLVDLLVLFLFGLGDLLRARHHLAV